MNPPYKLTVKVGAAEFVAEGPEESVRADYERFLGALNSAQPSKMHAGDGTPDPPVKQTTPDVDQDDMNEVFVREDDELSLRHLPPEGNDRVERALVLLLYGFGKVLQQRDVLVTRVNKALRRSGLGVDRLDRDIGDTHAALYSRRGARNSAQFSLNNQGQKQAAEWVRELARR